MGKNTDCLVKLTPEHDRPIYSPNSITPIHLRDELIIELALMQYYDIITTLHFSKYSSPIFAQRKASGKLRILINLRKINHLLRHDYVNNNFPIPTMSEASAHLSGKKIFAKMDCSQAYFSMQMADERSVQLLAFNFGGRTFAFKRLAQGLSRSPTAFSACVSKHLYPCVVSDKCFVYFDDLGSGAIDGDALIENLEQIFKKISELGFKLSIDKCEFGIPEIQFLGHTITGDGLKPNVEKLKKFIDMVKMPKNIKQTRRLIGFAQYFQKFIPNLAVKLHPFFKLFRKESNFRIESEHRTSLESLKKDMSNACLLTLKMAKPNCQYVIICDASFYAAGYVLMIEDYHEHAEDSRIKTYAPVAFGSHLFSPSQLKFSIYVKEFLSVQYAFETFELYIWGVSSKPIIVLTDNKSVTRFFQAKKLPGNLWNSVDYVLSFRFVLGHIPGKANAAADYLSRVHINPNTKLKMKLEDQIPVHNIDIEVLSNTPDNSLTAIQAITESNTANVLIPQLSITPVDNHINVTIDELSAFNDVMISSMFMTNPVDKMDISLCLDTLNLGKEQQKDSDILTAINWINNKIKPKFIEGSYDLQKYFKHWNRLLLEKGVLYRKFFDHSGRNYIKQIVVPKHLRTELLFRLHNSKMKGHLGIQKTIKEFRKKYYFPGLIEYLISYINNCLTCLQAKSPNHKTLQPPLNPVSSNTSLPADIMQIDIVGPLPKSGGFSYILTGVDIFSKYMCAQPLNSITAATVTKYLFQWFLRHCYIPLLIITDQGSQFTSQMLHELADLLEIKLEHATLKHAQTIGVVERSHGPL